MAQTAVEWLAEALAMAYKIEEINIRNFTIKKLIEQAKEMEKQEQKSNWMGGYLTCAMKDHIPYGKEYLNLLANKEIETEQYYNETFKSE
jgi:hypothetical protein